MVITMTWFCRSCSVLLPTVLLLLLTTEVVRAQHMTPEGSRIRRSAPSPDAAHTSGNLGSSGDVVTQGPHPTDQASGTRDRPATPTHTQPHHGTGMGLDPSAQPQMDPTGNSSHRGLPNDTSTFTPPSTTVGNTSNVLKPATTPSPLPGTSNPSDVVNASSDSTRAPEMSQPTPVEPSTSSIKPTLPASESPPTTNSLLIPVTSPVHTNASTVTANISATVHSTASTASGDPGRTTTSERVPTTNATSPGGGLHPRPRTKATEVVTAATATTTTPKPQPQTPRRSDCPVFTQSPNQRQSLVSSCLIAIASLAGLATFFMACSIVLCTRLSAARHRYRLRSGSGEGTEMVCISALMPDGDGPPMRHKIPKSNGALIPITDADSDGGDNLTLNSFLPDGDRV